ncbi:hypothetical protein H0H87_005213 [Tephrocybe sp. NHM501043]|nr:hypothetical protein H0H87_005213 [Tephrocybe sp. NHM501043]
MADVRLAVFAALASLAFLATVYSVAYNTYLDTSNPLLTHLPHPLSKSHYFANKANVLNVYFIKKAWGWTSAAFFFSWITSPSSIRTRERVVKWGVQTGMWLIFTAWFFGPAVLERLIVASGGECVLSLPTGDSITVPVELCFTRSQLSPASHPELFVTTSGFAPSVDWRAIPRLRRGHDVSGHIFLLTMAILFLTDQVRYSLRLTHRRTLHTIAVAANVILIAIWFLATYTTCLYFHEPFEKITGFILGAACFVITLIPEVEAAEKQSMAEKLKMTKES